jgi:hypothetical protein
VTISSPLPRLQSLLGQLHQVDTSLHHFKSNECPHLIECNAEEEEETHHRKLNYKDVHTEYRDNYLQWAMEKVTLLVLSPLLNNR